MVEILVILHHEKLFVPTLEFEVERQIHPQQVDHHKRQDDVENVIFRHDDGFLFVEVTIFYVK